MKKFLLSLVALLATVGVWAQTLTPVLTYTNITAPKELSAEDAKTIREMSAMTIVAEVDIVDITNVRDVSLLFTAVADYTSNKTENNTIWGVGVGGNSMRYVVGPRDGGWYSSSNGSLTTATKKIAFTYNGTTIGCFKDEGHVQDQGSTKPLSTFDGSNAKFYLGGMIFNTDTEWGTFNGTIHSVRIYNIAMTADQIADAFSRTVLTYDLTDISGNKYMGYYDGVANETVPTFTGIAGYSLSDGVWNEKNYSANITFPFPVSKEVVISSFKGTKDPGSRKYYVGTGDNEGNVMYGPSNPHAGIMDKWIIEPSCNNTAFTFKIKNVGTGTYITTSATTTTDAKETVTVTNAGTAFTVDEDNRFKLPTTKSDGSPLYLSAGSSTSNDKYLGAWTWNGDRGVHNGNCNYIYEVELPYSFTDNAGNIFEGTLDASGDYPWISGAQLSNISFDEMKFNATVTFPFPVSKEGGVTNATFIKTNQMTTGTCYLYANIAESKVVSKSTIAANGLTYLPKPIPSEYEKWQWAFYPTLTDEKFTFKIKNVAANKYVEGNAPVNPVTLGDTGAQFCWGATVGGNGFYLADNTNVFFSANSSSDGEQNCILWDKSGTTHVGSSLHFIVPSFRVEIGSTGYATLYTPCAVTLPDGLVAYSVTETNASHATLEELEGIPANAGAILKGTANTDYVITAGNVTSDWSANLLQGSSTDTYVTGPAYVLANGVSGIGLYKAELNKNANGESGDSHFKNNAGKAYLPVKSASARFLNFDFGTETAIESVEAETATDAVVYDLAGRRVKAAQKGLYIVNGKVVIK